MTAVMPRYIILARRFKYHFQFIKSRTLIKEMKRLQGSARGSSSSSMTAWQQWSGKQADKMTQMISFVVISEY